MIGFTVVIVALAVLLRLFWELHKESQHSPTCTCVDCDLINRMEGYEQ